MYSLYDNAALPALSSLIRISAGHRIFAPHRSFSQLVTSFFGAMYLGILRMLFVAWSFLRMLSHASTRLLTYKNSTTLTRLISIFSQFKNQTKLSAFFTRINQNQSVNCLLYLSFFSFSMQLSIFGFPTQKRGFLSFSERKTMLPQRQLLYHNKRF